MPLTRRRVYRLIQKLCVFEATKTLYASTAELAATPATTRVERIDQHALRRFINRGEAPGCGAFVDRLAIEGLHCFGVVAGGRLLSFAWFHEGVAEPSMNVGYHPGTATTLRLAGDAAFVFHAYTAPYARGRGLLTTVLRHAAAELRTQRGVAALVATTEIINRAARAAFARTGFVEAGVYCRFGWGSFAKGWYPPAKAPILAYG